ncbi:MAG: hypothetical protein A2Y12_03600 [Planctomycetes bacterium GWF2_42_9]|nr:MAG: hypothetical protein A2Y12_03600 [Planctomycetes bacterium GWF2_42_9]
MSKWYEESYARILVDNHVSDENPIFMSKFDPELYAKYMKLSGCRVSMVPACCINGNCYYPSKVGHVHKNLNGRDIFGETIKCLKEQNITPIAYYNVIWHKDAAKNNPAWRFYDASGSFKSGRYWLCCPNNPEYMRFSEEQICEIVSYDIAGLFIDMTFWPGICYCSVCRDRFKKEYGLEIPETINWADRDWMLLQCAREKWLNEVAVRLTQATKKHNPDISVVHQFSTVMLGWYLGLDSSFSMASDYASGDFYGGKNQHRLGAKVMSAFSSNVPFEFMTSRCVNLYDHTSTKSEEELFSSAAITLANGGAFLFIDAINPDGTLEESTYKRLADVNTKLNAFKSKIESNRPVLVGDVGLYYSMASYFDPKLNGTNMIDLLKIASISNMDSVVDVRALKEVLGTSIVLNQLHVPYRIVNDRCNDIQQFKTIIINNAIRMSAPEVNRLREYVMNGGTLIVTGDSSLYDSEGKHDDFALKDVFGVSFTGQRTGKISYLKQSGEYVSCDYTAPKIVATTASVIAHVCEPYTDPENPEHYASIHSNPPAAMGENVAVAVNKYGKGTCIYVYSSLMAMQNNAQQQFAAKLFRNYVSSEFKIITNAPSCVEITILQSTLSNRLLICLTNVQDEMPNIPINDLTAEIALPTNLRVSKNCSTVGNDVNSTVAPDGLVIEISIPRFETFVICEFDLFNIKE